jgi:kumamolisin
MRTGITRERKRTAYSLAIGLSLACALASASADVARVAVPGEPSVAGMTLAAAGTPRPNEVLHINFALKSAKKADLPAFIASQHDPNSPNFRKWLTPVQFGQRFGAPLADVQAVAAYAAAQGFKVTHVWENHLFVAADATVAQVQKAFGVTIAGYERPADLVAKGEPETFYAPSGSVTLPADVAARVDNVVGLDNLLQLHPKLMRKQSQQGPGVPTPVNPPRPPSASPQFSGPMAPADVSTFYGLDAFHNAGTPIDGDGQNIAIVSPTNYNFQNNIDFGNQWGLSGWTVWWVNVDGGSSDPVDGGNNLEACLDTEMMIGQAPHSTIWVFQFPNNGGDYIDVYNTLSSSSYQGSGTANIQVVSQSWGGGEPTPVSTYRAFMNDIDTALGQLNAEGVGFYNSSGDTGGVPIWPSTDPNATAVGGTDNLVDNSNGTYNSEQGWSGSGGGNSIYYGLPSWQTGPGVSNGYNTGMRQVPDISADGGPTPGYWVRADNSSGTPSWYQVWGTSASSPLWAVANLLLDQETNNYYGLTQWHSGSLNPELYWIGTNLNAYRSTLPGAFVFHDITTAESGSPYPCTDAWDYVTGWGSANFYKLWTDYNELWVGYDGRYGSISLSDGAGTQTQFNNLTTYSINTPYGCGGPADAPAGTLDVNIDGTDNYFGMGSLPVGYLWPNSGIISTGFSVGSHTITQSITLSSYAWTQTTTLSTKTFTVNAGVTGLTLSPKSVFGGSKATGTITLSAAAPRAGVVVSLASANSAAKVPASVTVAAGKTTATFTITTSVVSAVKSGDISASYSGSTASADLTVKPNVITSFRISPTSVVGPASATGTVTLGTKATSAVKVTFAVANGGVTVPTPASITIPVGSSTGTVTIKTKATKKKVVASVTASALKTSFKSTLTVNP